MPRRHAWGGVGSDFIDWLLCLLSRALFVAGAVIALGGIFFVLTGCAARQAIPLAAGADLVTTELALHQGGHELNPVPGMQSSGGRIALKAGATALIVWLCDWLEDNDHHGWASGLKWGTVAVWAGAATWNASLLRGE